MADFGTLGRMLKAGRAQFTLLPYLPSIGALDDPAMIVGFTRYSQDRSFEVLGQNKQFVLVMAMGSLLGAGCGGALLGTVPSAVLLPLLAAILVVSAIKTWRHS